MNLYEEYAVLDEQIKALTEQKDRLREDILAGLVEEGVEGIETAVGKFTVTHLKTWQYPNRVVALGEKYKTEKAKAEQTGEATYTETDSLRFTKITI